MKKILALAAGLLAFSYVLSFADITGIAEERQLQNDEAIDNIVFPDHQVVNVEIEIDQENFQSMLDNPLAEEYTMASIVYNGQRIDSVGIRTKGNSSLTSVARMESDRYSFKIDFSRYLKEQTLFGISKLNLNNNYNDPSYMREYLSYKIFEQMDVPAARTCYVNITINGAPWGLYLAVEQIDESFLANHFDNASGNLYKPDGVGSDLLWRGDNMDEYPGVVLKTNTDMNDHSDFLKMLNELNNGDDYKQYVDVDGFLRYLAVSTVLSNLDSYQGQMKHNYYLYENDGFFHIIPWDLNMSFGGFGMGRSEEQQTELKIDQPTMGSVEERPLIARILNEPEYLETYHQYVKTVIDSCLNVEEFRKTVDSVAELIAPYVEDDSTKFYTYEQFQQSLYNDLQGIPGLVSFVEARVTNVSQQLDGEISSVSENDGGTPGGVAKFAIRSDREALPDMDRGRPMPEEPWQDRVPVEPREGERGQGGMMQPGERGQTEGGEIGQETQYRMSGSEIVTMVFLLACLIMLTCIVYFVKRR